MNTSFKSLSFLLLFLPLFAQAQGLKKTPKGIEYQIFNRKPNARPLQMNDIVEARFEMRNYKDSLLVSNDVKGGKVIPATNSADPLDVLQFLAVGDSAVCYISVDSISKYTQRPLPSYVPNGTKVKYMFLIKDVKSQQEFDAEQQLKMKAKTTEQNKLFAEYANSKQLKPITTASGLQYAITKLGTGAKPIAGQSVTVHYRGTLLSGQEFDSSIGRNQPFTFNIGQGAVIPGWDEGVMLLPIGTKATLLIPSELAYGERGAGANIPPNSPLIFEIELLDAK